MAITETNKQEVNRIIESRISPLRDDLSRRIKNLEDRVGVDEEPFNIKLLEGNIEVVGDSSTIKSITPRSFYDQFKIEDDGSNGKLWVYVDGLTSTDSENWKNISLT